MQLILSNSSQNKIENILEYMSIRYDLEELSPEELIDALLDLGVEMIVLESASPSVLRDKLINICGHKIAGRM